jgi:hypothetical protein
MNTGVICPWQGDRSREVDHRALHKKARAIWEKENHKNFIYRSAASMVRVSYKSLLSGLCVVVEEAPWSITISYLSLAIYHIYNSGGSVIYVYGVWVYVEKSIARIEYHTERE